MEGGDRRRDRHLMSESHAIRQTIQRTSLYLLLFFIPISKAAIEILFWPLLIGWALERWSSGWTRSIWGHAASRRCFLAVVGYVGICGISILISTHPSLSLRGFIGKTLQYALFFIVAAEVASTPVVVSRCVVVMMASAFVVGLDAVIQELIGKDLLLGHQMTIYHRMSGPYENPSDLATYLMVMIPIVLMWLSRPERKTPWAGWLLMFLLAGCLLRTASVTGWLGLFCGALLLLASSRWTRTSVIVGGIAFLVVGCLWLQKMGRLEGAVMLSNAGTRDRLVIWQAGWRMVQARPILGHGVNTFMANYLDYWVGGEQQPRYAHNCYLQAAAETGFLGLTAFLYLWGSAARLWWRAVKRVGQSHATRALLLGLGAGLLGFLAQAAFDTNFYALRHATLFWTLAGIATGLAVHTLTSTERAGQAV